MWAVIRDVGDYSDRSVDVIALAETYEQAIVLGRQCITYEMNKEWESKECLHERFPKELLQIVINNCVTVTKLSDKADYHTKIYVSEKLVKHYTHYQTIYIKTTTILCSYYMFGDLSYNLKQLTVNVPDYKAIDKHIY